MKKELDTLSLKIGDEIKNYKTMCKLLNEEIKGGTAKKSQIKNWEKYFDFIKDGQKYIINDIYKESLNNNALNNRTIYAQNITNMILLMIQENKEDIIITKKELMLKLGMINEKYYDKKINSDFDTKWKSEASKNYNISQFFNNSYRKLNSILESSFESLDKRSLLEFNKNCYMIRYKNENFHLADENERDIIKSTIYNMLKKFNFKNEGQAFIKKEYQEYQKETRNYLEYNYNITGFYKVIRIHPYNIDNIECEINYKKEQKQLNTKVIHKLREQNQKIYDKQYALKYDNNFGEQFKMFMYDIDFVEKQNILTDYFIELND